ncbi:hypothetical protein HK102_000607 [Quaeritorhiza haematococci]|nr:hypothetical protein HK102_000607 [Quaeritorhiza haematococci]
MKTPTVNALVAFVLVMVERSCLVSVAALPQNLHSNIQDVNVDAGDTTISIADSNSNNSTLAEAEIATTNMTPRTSAPTSTANDTNDDAFQLSELQNIFSEAMRRIEAIVTGQVIDIPSIIAVGTEFIQRIQTTTSDPRSVIKQGTELVEAITGKMKEKGVEAGTVFAVDQSLKGALNIAGAVVPPMDGGEKKLKGCWLGEFIRLRKVPQTCKDLNKELVGLQCLDKCAEGFNAVGPLCWKGIEARTRGEVKWAECAPGHVKIAGLCYDKPCGPNFDKEFGAMCIATKCPPHAPHKCGRLCLGEGANCASFVGDLVNKGKDAALEAAQMDFAGAIGPVADMIRTLASFPQCFEKP